MPSAANMKSPPARWRWYKGVDGKRDGSIVLSGNWTNTSRRPRISEPWRPAIRIREDYASATLDCMKCFPDAESLDVISFRVTDLTGVYHARGLRKLRVVNVWPKHLALDFEKLPQLRRLSIHWTKRLRNQGALRRMTQLNIRGCEGVKSLDLSGLRSLKTLLIGPAKGVETLSLEGISKLAHLSLVLMPRLLQIRGRDFLHTVTRLDIRGSDSIPREVLSAFTKLQVVEVGMRSKLDPSCFGRCKPVVIPFPV